LNTDENVLSHTLEVADIEHFQSFADWMAEHSPEAVLTFVDKPIWGKPYVQIDYREPMNRYTLMLDEGQTFNIGDNMGTTDSWITGGRI
jgi:hypothetical protein